jgi:Rieske Fe-S protein
MRRVESMCGLTSFLCSHRRIRYGGRPKLMRNFGRQDIRQGTKCLLSCTGCIGTQVLSRRSVLKSALGAGLILHLVSVAAGAPDNDKSARPQAGDILVFSRDDRKGQLITAQDLSLGGAPVFAYPMNPTTQTIRDGSRLNRVLLLHLAPDEITVQTRAVAADGIIGYSAVCTHTGCDVVGWQQETRQLVCPCHASTFDTRDRARVVSGPAPRPLPVLPLQLIDGKITVAGAFSGRVGATQQ